MYMIGYPVISITEVSLCIIMIITQREKTDNSFDSGTSVVHYLHK